MQVRSSVLTAIVLVLLLSLSSLFFTPSLRGSETAFFGGTTAGTNYNFEHSNLKDASRFQVVAGDGDVSKLTFWCRAAGSGSTIKGVIYSDYSASPEALLGSTNEVTVTDTNYHWEDLPFASTVHVTNGLYYWLGFHAKTDIEWEDASGKNVRFNSDTYSDGPSDPFGSFTAYKGWHMSIYATYTLSHAPAPMNIGVSTTRAGAPCQFHVEWSDPDGLDTCIFSTNNTGIWVNNTIPVSGTVSWANITRTLDSSVGSIVRFRWYCSDADGDMGETGMQTLITTGGDATIAEMMPRMSESAIYATAYDLQNFKTRKYGYGGNVEAATYLYNKLGNISGLSVEYQSAYNNVIATLPGTDTTSSAVYMVGAHYDSTSSDPNDAPGATDNGGGAAIVLELARIMSQYRFNHTLKFALWNAEESGTLGSGDYAKYAHDNGINISLYINLDGCSYDPNDVLILDIIWNQQSSWVSDMMTEHNTLYGINFTLKYNDPNSESDHTPFWQYGYTAVMTRSEANGPAHSPDDTVDQVSTLFAKKTGQLAISVLARLAEALNFGLSLDAGWNMVSFPVIPADKSFSSIFSGLSYYQVLTWSGTSYVTPTDIEAGRGYWVLVLSTTTVDITGLPVESYELDLPAGWSMIGSVFNATVNGDTVFPPPTYYQLLTWNGFSYFDARPLGIEPGKGYWSLVLEPTHILVE